MQAQVELKNLNKLFVRKTGDTIHGLKDINLSIYPGEIIGVIGTNGAGKSTLFNALTGQIKINSGEIILAGKQINQLTQVEIAKFIGRVFQDPTLGTAPRMTVFENLMLASKRGQGRGLGKSLTDKNMDDMKEYLSQFHLDLENRLDIPMENLSGGQRQTVSLVMATLQKPELLLLDEHTAALDPRTGRQIMKMTQSMIKEYELTTLMITHHLQDALDYSDRVLMMHQGQIARAYTKEDLKGLKAGDLYQQMENLVTEEAING